MDGKDHMIIRMQEKLYRDNPVKKTDLFSFSVIVYNWKIISPLGNYVVSVANVKKF